MAASAGCSEVTPNQQESGSWIGIAAGCAAQGPRYSRVILALFFALNRVISALRGIDLTPEAGAPADGLSATYAVTNWKFCRGDVAVLVPGWHCEKTPQATRVNKNLSTIFRLESAI
jgi:hypothetical protein